MFCTCGHEFDPARETVTTSSPFTIPPGPPLTIRKIITFSIIAFLAIVCVVFGLGLILLGNLFWDFLLSFSLVSLIGLLLFSASALSMIGPLVYIIWSSRKP